MTATAVLFPGQGSLTPDAAARARSRCPDLVEHAAELLGADPFERAGESTRFAQPATFLASIAGWRENAPTDVVAMAGHSLGEIAALTAAGVLPEHVALELVVLRGELMADAPAGGMTALLGASLADATELADRHGVCVANDNAPGQVVLSGPPGALSELAASARAAGLRAMPLDVAGAFHSPAMGAAVEPFRDAVSAVTAHPGTAPVISGLTAQPFTDLASDLADALVAPVRWRDVMARLVALGAERFVDVGPGRVLERLTRRNVEEARAAVA